MLGLGLRHKSLPEGYRDRVGVLYFRSITSDGSGQIVARFPFIIDSKGQFCFLFASSEMTFANFLDKGAVVYLPSSLDNAPILA